MNKKRILSLILLFLMLFSVALPISVSADDELIVDEYDSNEYYFADGEEVFADGEEVFADGEEVFADDEEVFADDEEVFADSEEVFADDEEVFADNEEVFADDEEVFADNEEVIANNEESAEDYEEIVLEYANADSFNNGDYHFTKDLKDQSVAVGDTVVWEVEAPGTTTYQWQYSTDGGKTWNNYGSNSTTFSFKMEQRFAGRKYRCIANNGTTSITSFEATLTVANIIYGDFEFMKIGDTNNLALVKYTGNAASITVPAAVNGMTVTEIGKTLANNEKGVFEDNTTLTSVTLPNSITVIREKAFKGCTNLSTMTTHG